MNDTELFELCRSVYEATGWTNTSVAIDDTDGFRYLIFEDVLFDNEVPLYTSDYLLEKLPKYLKANGEENRFELVPQGYRNSGPSLWCATYADNRHDIPYLASGDTPLNALLKLTLTLTEAGILTNSGGGDE